MINATTQLRVLKEFVKWTIRFLEANGWLLLVAAFAQFPMLVIAFVTFFVSAFVVVKSQERRVELRPPVVDVKPLQEEKKQLEEKKNSSTSNTFAAHDEIYREEMRRFVSELDQKQRAARGLAPATVEEKKETEAAMEMGMELMRSIRTQVFSMLPPELTRVPPVDLFREQLRSQFGETQRTFEQLFGQFQRTAMQVESKRQSHLQRQNQQADWLTIYAQKFNELPHGIFPEELADSITFEMMSRPMFHPDDPRRSLFDATTLSRLHDEQITKARQAVQEQKMIPVLQQMGIGIQPMDEKHQYQRIARTQFKKFCHPMNSSMVALKEFRDAPRKLRIKAQLFLRTFKCFYEVILSASPEVCVFITGNLFPVINQRFATPQSVAMLCAENNLVERSARYFLFAAHARRRSSAFVGPMQESKEEKRLVLR